MKIRRGKEEPVKGLKGTNMIRVIKQIMILRTDSDFKKGSLFLQEIFKSFVLATFKKKKIHQGIPPSTLC